MEGRILFLLSKVANSCIGGTVQSCSPEIFFLTVKQAFHLKQKLQQQESSVAYVLHDNAFTLYLCGYIVKFAFLFLTDWITIFGLSKSIGPFLQPCHQ